MNDAMSSRESAWVAALLQPSLLWQAGALVACLALAWLAHRRYVVWCKRHPASAGDSTSLALTAITAGRVLVFPLAACVSLLLAWGAFAALQQPDGMVRIALSLAVAFGLVRLAVYLLSTALNPGPLLRASESLIVAVVWVGVALHLLGWLPRVVIALDAAAFSVGDTRISVLLVLRALAVVLLGWWRRRGCRACSSAGSWVHATCRPAHASASAR